MPFFFFDPTIVLLIPAIVLSLYANSKVRSTYNKYNKISSRNGLSGKDVAKLILQNNGIQDVEIESVKGRMTDHYDLRTRTLRLSEDNYNGKSLAAVGVAAHEVGHAIQHSQNYAPLGLRSAIIPVSSIGSKLAFPLILAGFFFQFSIFGYSLMDIGIALFSFAVIFTLITLPVESNASSRAIAAIEGHAILDKEEITGAKKVLNAAAMTYIAAAAVAILELIRLLVLRNMIDN